MKAFWICVCYTVFFVADIVCYVWALEHGWKRPLSLLLRWIPGSGFYMLARSSKQHTGDQT